MHLVLGCCHHSVYTYISYDATPSLHIITSPILSRLFCLPRCLPPRHCLNSPHHLTPLLLCILSIYLSANLAIRPSMHTTPRRLHQAQSRARSRHRDALRRRSAWAGVGIIAPPLAVIKHGGTARDRRCRNCRRLSAHPVIWAAVGVLFFFCLVGFVGGLTTFDSRFVQRPRCCCVNAGHRPRAQRNGASHLWRRLFRILLCVSLAVCCCAVHVDSLIRFQGSLTSSQQCPCVGQ